MLFRSTGSAVRGIGLLASQVRLPCSALILSHEGQTRRQKHKPDELPHNSFLILKSRDGARLLSDLLERENPFKTLICQNLTVRSASQGNYVLQDHLSRPGICTVEAEGAGAFLEAQISYFLDLP